MAPLFFVVALIYSMVGLGGGSSYIAIMVLFDIPYTEIPFLARLCNLIVASGNIYYYARHGHHSLRLSWPFIVGAIPMAFIGAALPANKMLFVAIVGASLVFLGFKQLYFDKWKEDYIECNPIIWSRALLIGCLLGLISGLTGIGSGIFLIPILHMLKWGTPKQIGASASVLIAASSLAGLAGQVAARTDISFLASYWLMLFAVFAGGQLGGFLGSYKLPEFAVKKCAAALLLFVGMRILIKVFV